MTNGLTVGHIHALISALFIPNFSKIRRTHCSSFALDYHFNSHCIQFTENRRKENRRKPSSILVTVTSRSESNFERFKRQREKINGMALI